MPGPEMFITGGNEATPHEYPWMAALFFEMNGQRYFCGGTLVKLILLKLHPTFWIFLKNI